MKSALLVVLSVACLALGYGWHQEASDRRASGKGLEDELALVRKQNAQLTSRLQSQEKKQAEARAKAEKESGGHVQD